MPNPTISSERIRAHLEALAEIGADPEEADPKGAGPVGGAREGPAGRAARGVSRFPYSEAHAQAVRAVAGWMREAGLAPGCDPFGNLVGVRAGTADGPAILLGSHLDTVPHGGIFDGALGVLAGVEVARALHEAGRALHHTLAVVGFADEEGYAFALGTLASRCLIGEIPAGRFAGIRGRDGRTLAEALAAFDPGLPRLAVPASAGAYLELHVEQGPILAQTGRRAAAVTAITGMARTTVVLEGEANHAGTTPMDGRRDALVGAAEIVLAVKSLAEVVGPPVVGTVGALALHPGATNIVPGRVEFTVEFRTPDATRLADLCARLDRQIAKVAHRHGLGHRIGPWDRKPPAPMDPAVRAAIVEAITTAGCEPFEMSSGAGHDAMILAGRVPAGMIFVPSVGGISHSPSEWTEWDDAALGARVLLETVLRLDGRGPLPAHTLSAAGPR